MKISVHTYTEHIQSASSRRPPPQHTHTHTTQMLGPTFKALRETIVTASFKGGKRANSEEIQIFIESCVRQGVSVYVCWSVCCSLWCSVCSMRGVCSVLFFIQMKKIKKCTPYLDYHKCVWDEIYRYLCMFICTCIYTYKYAYTYIYINLYSVYTSVREYLYIHIFPNMYIYLHISMYIHIYIYIWAHI